MDDDNNNNRSSNIQTIVGCNISDIPNPILVDIILKLTIKEIVTCKCVCKEWRQIISDPQFAKQHLAQEKIHLMIRPENLDYPFFYLLDHRIGGDDDGLFKMDLDVKFRLPLFDYLPEYNIVNHDELIELGVSSIYSLMKSSRIVNGGPRIKLSTRKKTRYTITNSCNGLLCLSENLDRSRRPIIVWNPITDEFITLPLSSNHNYKINKRVKSYYGLGFSPKNNEYKFLRASYDDLNIGDNHRDSLLLQGVEICKVETGSWTELVLDAPPPFSFKCNNNPTYVNGALYWIPLYQKTKEANLNNIVSFDMDTDKFSSVPLPPIRSNGRVVSMSMGALRKNKLCVINAYDLIFDVWELMIDDDDDNNIGKSYNWINMFSNVEIFYYNLCRIESFKPLSYNFDDGTLIMFHNMYDGLIVCYPQNKKKPFRYLKLHKIRNCKFLESVSHIPSFISLEHIVNPTSQVKVSSVNSRWGNLVFSGDTVHQKLREDFDSTIVAIGEP